MLTRFIIYCVIIMSLTVEVCLAEALTLEKRLDSSGESLFDNYQSEEFKRSIKKSKKGKKGIRARDLKKLVDTLESVERETQSEPLYKSNYLKLEDLFAGADLARGNIGELVMVGKCVRRTDPEIFMDGVVNVYVVEKGGVSSIHMTPMVLSQNSLANYTREQIVQWHSKLRKEMPQYTPLSMGLPVETPLMELFMHKFKDSMMFSYTWRSNLGEKEVQVKRELYSLRKGKTEEGKAFYIIANHCSSVDGCRASKRDASAMFRYTDALMYCYYHEQISISERKKENPKRKIIRPKVELE